MKLNIMIIKYLYIFFKAFSRVNDALTKTDNRSPKTPGHGNFNNLSFGEGGG